MGMDTYLRVYKKNTSNYKNYHTYSEFGYRKFNSLYGWCSDYAQNICEDGFMTSILDKKLTEDLLDTVKNYALDPAGTHNFNEKCECLVEDLETVLKVIDWETEEFHIEFSM